jgi:hypothetical protein
LLALLLLALLLALLLLALLLLALLLLALLLLILLLEFPLKPRRGAYTPPLSPSRPSSLPSSLPPSRPQDICPCVPCPVRSRCSTCTGPAGLLPALPTCTGTWVSGSSSSGGSGSGVCRCCDPVSSLLISPLPDVRRISLRRRRLLQLRIENHSVLFLHGKAATMLPPLDHQRPVAFEPGAAQKSPTLS